MARPSVFTAKVLQKLEEAFCDGATDTEACFVATISPSSLYNYQQAHPEFLERKEGLKNMLKYRAKANVAKSIKAGDVKMSQWYLERKAKDEFGQKELIVEHRGQSLAELLDLAALRRKQLSA